MNIEDMKKQLARQAREADRASAEAKARAERMQLEVITLMNERLEIHDARLSLLHERLEHLDTRVTDIRTSLRKFTAAGDDMFKLLFKMITGKTIQ